jgi:hypothetical protein
MLLRVPKFSNFFFSLFLFFPLFLLVTYWIRINTYLKRAVILQWNLSTTERQGTEILGFAERFLSYRYLNLYPSDCKMFWLKTGFLYAQVPFKRSSAVFKVTWAKLSRPDKRAKRIFYVILSPFMCCSLSFNLKCPLSNYTRITIIFKHSDHTQFVSLNNYFYWFKALSSQMHNE